MCEFCEKYDFTRIGAKMEDFIDRLPTIYFAGGSGTVPVEDQFKFCPQCGQRIITYIQRERVMSDEASYS